MAFYCDKSWCRYQLEKASDMNEFWHEINAQHSAIEKPSWLASPSSSSTSGNALATEREFEMLQECHDSITRTASQNIKPRRN